MPITKERLKGTLDLALEAVELAKKWRGRLVEESAKDIGNLPLRMLVAGSYEEWLGLKELELKLREELWAVEGTWKANERKLRYMRKKAGRSAAGPRAAVASRAVLEELLNSHAPPLNTHQLDWPTDEPQGEE